MFAHLCRWAPAMAGRIAHHFSIRLVGVGLAALLTGCAPPPAPVATPHAADPHAPAKAAVYRGVIGPYVSQRPRDPSAWTQSNERVAPQEKP